MSELIKRLKEERIQGSSAVLNYSNFDYWVNWDDIVDIVEDHDQPQLNENQKALVIWMQENECYNGDPLESISDLFLEGTPSEHFPDLPLSCVEAAYQSLNNQQKIEMVQKYLEQYFEQETGGRVMKDQVTIPDVREAMKWQEKSRRL